MHLCFDNGVVGLHTKVRKGGGLRAFAPIADWYASDVFACEPQAVPSTVENLDVAVEPDGTSDEWYYVDRVREVGPFTLGEMNR